MVNPDEVPAPRTAAVAKTTAARPVPNTAATKNASTTIDVAALSAQPGKVEATSVADLAADCGGGARSRDQGQGLLRVRSGERDGCWFGGEEDRRRGRRWR